MSERFELLKKFSNGYGVNEEEKNVYRGEIRKMIGEKMLFVAPVQPHVRGKHRAAAFNIIYPIYRSRMLHETLANCFVCSKCDHIFLHLRTNGTATLSSHKCVKMYIKSLQEAEIVVNEAQKVAQEAVDKVKAAETTVEKLLSPNESSKESPSTSNVRENSNDGQSTSKLAIHAVDAQQVSMQPAQTDEDQPASKRPRHAEVIAEAIEKFVQIGRSGKTIKANDVIDHIPNNFMRFSWQRFLKKFTGQNVAFDNDEQPNSERVHVPEAANGAPVVKHAQLVLERVNAKAVNRSRIVKRKRPQLVLEQVDVAAAEAAKHQTPTKTKQIASTSKRSHTELVTGTDQNDPKTHVKTTKTTKKPAYKRTPPPKKHKMTLRS